MPIPRLLLTLSLLAPALPAAAQSIGGGEGKLVTLQGIRSATVAPQGLGFASLAIGTRAEDDPEDDLSSSLALGFGLGDAAESLGLQFTASLGPVLEDPGESGSLSIKAARQVSAGRVPAFVGLSADRLAGWGDRADDDATLTLAYTAFPQLRLGGDGYPLMLTLGAGTDVRDEATTPGLYAGAGIGLSRNFGASLAWTGEDVALGAVTRIEGLDRWRFTASVDDLFDEDDGRRLTVAATTVIDDLFGRR